ncbi:MAG: Ppx/GppA family phosphatase [Burkholderiaceae bacterium]|nr:MAG: Ppx/GppA family phosphatase [Burkholderiaceae bacterium]
MNKPSPLPHDDDTRWPGQLAAIDMGSNSFRLEIAQLDQGCYRRVDYLKETVRLGGGLDANGLLTDEASTRGLACLARFAQRLQGFAPQQVRAVATQTLREARNRDAFLVRAQTVLGHPIEVISGREEARLIYAGVARLQPSHAPRLVVDIGGRSTEMILGHGRKALHAESFQVGSVSLSMRFFGDGRLGAEAFRAAQVAAGAELEEALEPFAPVHWREALGASGTVGAVSQLLAASGITDGRITPAGLRWLIGRCIECGRIDRLDLPGLKEDRRAVIAGGIAILYTLAAHFGIESLQPARGALRQGVVFDLDERLHATALPQDGHDLRDATVRELQRRFMVDVQQARRVSRVAESLYAQVQPRAGREARRELLWACALHEMGMMVSHHDHHRHSAYLLAHVDAPGFSQSQQRRVAELVLGQRGGLRKVETGLTQEAFAWQVLCLRLAIIKCHARADVQHEAIALARDGMQARLTFDAAWAAAHPRTLYLLREELQAWARGGVLKLTLRD